MGIIRGKIYHPKIINRVLNLGGPSPFLECECGKWLSRETGEHIEVETLTWEQVVERWGPKCPDEKD